MPKGKGGYYAVANGRETGVYNSWDACRAQTEGYSNASFKRFDTPSEARAFASGGGSSSYGGGGRSYGGGGGGYGYGGGSRHADVYTDGACHSNGRSGARAGIGVYWGDDSPNNVSESLGGRQTNNRAEIKAAERAIGQAKHQGYKSVTVNTDSDFLHKSATQWMPKWESNNYTSSTGAEVKNRSDFESLGKTMKGIDVSWNRVPAHSGIHGNEKADRLANEGARQHRY